MTADGHDDMVDAMRYSMAATFGVPEVILRRPMLRRYMDELYLPEERRAFLRRLLADVLRIPLAVVDGVDVFRDEEWLTTTFAVPGGGRAYCIPDEAVSAVTTPGHLFPWHASGASRRSGESRLNATMRVLGSPGVDAVALDDRPDDCWRCDAAPAAGDLGLCGRCHADMASS